MEVASSLAPILEKEWFAASKGQAQCTSRLGILRPWANGLPLKCLSEVVSKFILYHCEICREFYANTGGGGGGGGSVDFSF